MDMNNATITRGPHLLYTGADGSKTYGVTVANNDATDIARGRCASWNVNDCTILANDGYREFLGLSDESFLALRAELAALMAADAARDEMVGLTGGAS
jgi:hypothetical protein